MLILEALRYVSLILPLFSDSVERKASELCSVLVSHNLCFILKLSNTECVCYATSIKDFILVAVLSVNIYINPRIDGNNMSEYSFQNTRSAVVRKPSEELYPSACWGSLYPLDTTPGLSPPLQAICCPPSRIFSFPSSGLHRTSFSTNCSLLHSSHLAQLLLHKYVLLKHSNRAFLYLFTAWCHALVIILNCFYVKVVAVK